jgi:hypothetical protein
VPDQMTLAAREEPSHAVPHLDRRAPELAVIVPTRNRRGGGACRISLIHRRAGHRTGGLGGAVVDGLRAVAAPWACVLDADLQHPPELILLVRHGGLRTTEVGFTFADRHAGESKGTLREGLTYLAALGDLRLGREAAS